MCIRDRVKDAEQHADDDKKRRDLVDAKNQLDTLIYSTEQSLKDNGENLKPEDKQQIEADLAESKQVLESATTVDELKKQVDKLSKSAHAIAKQMYEAGAKQNAEGGDDAGAKGEAGADDVKAEAEAEEDVVDADFEEVE